MTQTPQLGLLHVSEEFLYFYLAIFRFFSKSAFETTLKQMIFKSSQDLLEMIQIYEEKSIEFGEWLLLSFICIFYRFNSIFPCEWKGIRWLTYLISRSWNAALILPKQVENSNYNLHCTGIQHCALLANRTNLDPEANIYDICKTHNVWCDKYLLHLVVKVYD